MRAPRSRLATLIDLAIKLVFAGTVIVAGMGVAPRILSYQTYIVRTGSMSPAILPGAVVIVEPVPPVTLKVGDVITYRRPDQPQISITHRIVTIRYEESSPGGPIIRTKGDANPTPDPWHVQLYGTAWREVLSVPFLGYIFDIAQHPAGRVLFFMVPAAAMGLFVLDRIWRYLRVALQR